MSDRIWDERDFQTELRKLPNYVRLMILKFRSEITSLMISYEDGEVTDNQLSISHKLISYALEDMSSVTEKDDDD